MSGEWPPGHKIPFEHELMAVYGCSRMTVNKALSELARSGLIERRRRAGSFVARPGVQSAVLEIPDIQAEVTARRETYGYKLLFSRRRRATARDSRYLTVRTGTTILSLRCLHLAGGRPFVLEERVINLAAVPEATRIDFSAVPPGTWLLNHVPWTEAEHRITAVGADAAISDLLALPQGRACLVVERRTWLAGEPITRVRQVFPGDRHELVARFAPTQA